MNQCELIFIKKKSLLLFHHQLSAPDDLHNQGHDLSACCEAKTPKQGSHHAHPSVCHPLSASEMYHVMCHSHVKTCMSEWTKIQWSTRLLISRVSSLKLRLPRTWVKRYPWCVLRGRRWESLKLLLVNSPRYVTLPSDLRS